MKKIIPHLWFNNNLQEAMDFYLAIFKEGEIKLTKTIPDGRPGHDGFLLAHFELAGQEFIAINGGPMFPFTEAVSFYIGCDTQEEIDYYWEKLLADGGKPSQCGWLKDKFGLSWQVAPRLMFEMLSAPDNGEQIKRVMSAMMTMTKFDLQKIKDAANQ